MSNSFDSSIFGYVNRLVKDLNISPQQAVGILGQLGYESGLQAVQEKNPIIAGSRGGYGWAQWTGSRRKAFEQFAKEKGLDIADNATNLDYLIHELKNTPEKGVLNRFKNINDPKQVGALFTKFFLRPGIVNEEGRAKWTQKAEDAYNRASGFAAKNNLNQVSQKESWDKFNNSFISFGNINDLQERVRIGENVNNVNNANNANNDNNPLANSFKTLNNATKRMGDFSHQLVPVQPEPLVNNMFSWNKTNNNNEWKLTPSNKMWKYIDA